MSYIVRIFGTIRKCQNCNHIIGSADEAVDTCLKCGINLDVMSPVEVA